MTPSALASNSIYEVPLIPMSHEPAFLTFTAQSYVYLFSHARQLIGEFNLTGGERTDSFASSVGSQPGTNTGNSAVAMTCHSTMHGHPKASFAAPVLESRGGQYGFMYARSYTGGSGQEILNGHHNSRVTGVWANKARRDNLCLQRFWNVPGTNAGPNYGGTQVSIVGWGAISNPITYSRDFNSPNNSFTSATSFGLIGYNEKSKWLCVADVSGANVTLYVYKNVEPPTHSNTDVWFSNIVHGSRVSTTFALTVTDSLDSEHFKIIPLDDGNIRIVNKQASNSLRTFLLTGNSGLTSTSWTKGTEDTIATTTSYHDTSYQYLDALIHLTTYDGKYTVCITQYYYHGSGMCAYIIRHSDGKYFKVSHTDSSNAYTSAMLGKNNWMVCNGANFDGPSAILLEYPIDMLFEMGLSAATDVSTYYLRGNIDTGSASTAYGGLINIQSPLPLQLKGKTS